LQEQRCDRHFGKQSAVAIDRADDQLMSKRCERSANDARTRHRKLKAILRVFGTGARMMGRLPADLAGG
jgi:hypothetical protein